MDGGHDWVATCSRSLRGSAAAGGSHLRPQDRRAVVAGGGPAQPDTAEAAPQFSARIAGSYERQQWKQQLHDRLAGQAATIDPGPAGLTIALTAAPGRNWASLWKPVIDAFGPVLGEDPTRPFHPHNDRIVSLGLHHTIDTSIAHDVIIDAWWTRRGRRRRRLLREAARTVAG